MSKPGGDPSSGISSEDVLIPTERHPACRQREARSGSFTERENLAGDAKGKGSSGSNRKAESTDAPERGGLLRSSGEAAAMVMERRGRVIDDELGQPAPRRHCASRLKPNAINAPGSASSRKEANSAAFWRNANSA